MLNRTGNFAAVAALMCCCVSQAQDQQAATGQGLDDALLGGKAQLNLRYRYEFVDQDSFSEDANASTLRLRLNYGSGKWRGWSGFTEFDYVFEVLLNDFNSGAGSSPADRNQYPVVADPKGADLNQLYLDYEGFSDTRLRFGRQRILLDNQRFVGGVGWRQNEQTYDGVSALWTGLARTDLSYGYIAQVNRIFGERSAAGEHDVDIHLLNGRIGLSEKWRITPYAYYIDNDDAAAFSNSTFGARADGEITLDNGSLKLLVELATQSDAANNPTDYDASYLHLKADWAMKNGLTVGLGFESLGGDENVPGQAFRTPLATLHAFQGWADQFLATPNAGVDDFYAGGKYKYRKWTFQAIYHDFSAADGSSDWGSEIDVAASRSLGDRYSLLLKGAFFSADNAGFTDTSKFWLQLVAKY